MVIDETLYEYAFHQQREMLERLQRRFDMLMKPASTRYDIYSAALLPNSGSFDRIREGWNKAKMWFADMRKNNRHGIGGLELMMYQCVKCGASLRDVEHLECEYCGAMNHAKT